MSRLSSIDRTLETMRQDVDAALDRLLPGAEAHARAIHDALRYAVFAGGKRVRPALLLLAGEAVGGTRGDLLDAAAGIELIHTASLILDDLPSQDNAPLRRGRPATHIRYGEATAVLASTALLTLGIRSVSENARQRGLTGEALARAVRLVADAIGTDGMIGGQIVDLEKGPGHDTMETLEYVHSRKTGALFVACAHVGGLLAGAREEEIEALGHAAKNLGLAYQITDDILDLVATPADLGKPTGQDLGKTTFAMLFGVEVSRRVAGELFEATAAALTHLGPRGRDLLAFTRWVEKRMA